MLAERLLTSVYNLARLGIGDRFRVPVPLSVNDSLDFTQSIRITVVVITGYFLTMWLPVGFAEFALSSVRHPSAFRRDGSRFRCDFHAPNLQMLENREGFFLLVSKSTLAYTSL